ncbi:MAG: hypothetical protein VX273_03620 [Acidobacteriota bacterium]|nr:hypothetical protein [Acidobacteriota bacterium]
MRLLALLQTALHDPMRGYYVAAIAGVTLTVSAFLPWVVVGENNLGSFPSMSSVWIAGLGLSATVLAALSLITRKNSRHPLLVVGLLAFGILFVVERLMVRMATERAWATEQASALVGSNTSQVSIEAAAAPGLYLGLGSAFLIVLFGLTIVVKRASNPYTEETDDDV